MKATAIYVRVSSRTQDQRSQMADLKQWARAEDPDTEVLWYQDQALTGTKMDRPEFVRLLHDVRSGKVGKVACWRLDRLGRSNRGMCDLFDQLVEAGADLVSLKEGILGLRTPAGRVFATILASLAVYETEVRGERQRAGIDAARAAGKRWGGSRPGRRLKVKPEHLEQVPRLKAEGASVAGIARLTGLSRKTVYRLLAARTAPPAP